MDKFLKNTNLIKNEKPKVINKEISNQLSCSNF